MLIDLPLNKMSNLHPTDAGIIAAIKMRYKKRQLEQIFDSVDQDVANIYHTAQFTIMI